MPLSKFSGVEQQHTVTLHTYLSSFLFATPQYFPHFPKRKRCDSRNHNHRPHHRAKRSKATFSNYFSKINNCHDQKTQDTIINEGSLEVEGKIGIFSKRHFILRPDGLYYYSNHTSNRTLGALQNLAACTIALEEDRKKKRNAAMWRVTWPWRRPTDSICCAAPLKKTAIDGLSHCKNMDACSRAFLLGGLFKVVFE